MRFEVITRKLNITAILAKEKSLFYVVIIESLVSICCVAHFSGTTPLSFFVQDYPQNFIELHYFLMLLFSAKDLGIHPTHLQNHAATIRIFGA